MLMKHELLAPAGSLEAGYAALYYGADAVYLGLTKFSARAGAENFTADELDEFTAYAHSLGRKVFVALNTILTEAEVRELPEIFAVLAHTKVDALIIQDLGVYYLAKKILPQIELHASTQMAVHNVEGARFLQRLGFERVVLARELTLDEIRAIATALPNLELEVFVHGALCYSYSGQCLFSALEYGKSANRGRCVYPCRNMMKHNCSGEEQGCRQSHLFSMKDLALEEEVLQIPALSLKIEGRKKSPLYVAAATNYYRHILDGKKKDLREAEDIKQIFSRPWCRFHFNGKNKDVVEPDFVGHRGLPVGKIERIGRNRLIFKTAHYIARYDGVQIDAGGDEKPFGFGIKNLFVNGKSVAEAPAGQTVELELPEAHPFLAVGAPVYLASSSAVKGRYAYQKPKPHEFCNPVPLAVTVEIGADTVWALSGSVAVSVTGDFMPAKDAAKVEDAVRRAFAKTGGTPFAVMSVSVKNPDGRFVPVSLLNELRRRLLQQAEEQGLHNSGKINLPETPVFKTRETAQQQNPALFFLRTDSKMEDWATEDLEQTWFVLPQICRNTKRLADVVQLLYRSGARRFVAENYYAFELLRRYKNIHIGAGSFIYVMNHYATAVLKDIGTEWAIPALESSPDNMAELVSSSSLPLVQVTYAFPPLFTSAVCIRPNSCRDCSGGERRFFLERNGRKYIAVSRDCQVQVFAEKPYERTPVKGVWGTIQCRKRP